MGLYSYLKILTKNIFLKGKGFDIEHNSTINKLIKRIK